MGSKDDVSDDELRDAFASLPRRAQLVITMWYGLEGPPHTVREVTAELGVAEQRILAVRANAIAALREAIRRDRPAPSGPYAATDGD